MFNTADCSRNAWLATLTAPDCNRLAPHLERVSLSRNQMLHDCDVLAHYVYFPVDCSVSLQTMLRNGSSDQIAIVGNEGRLGVALIMGDDHSPSRALVRRAGYA